MDLGNGNGKGGNGLVRRIALAAVTLGGGVLGWGVRDWVQHVNTHIETSNHGYERLAATELQALRNKEAIAELVAEIRAVRQECLEHRR